MAKAGHWCVVAGCNGILSLGRKTLSSDAECEKAGRGGDEMPDAHRSNCNARSAAQIYRDVLAPVSSYKAGEGPSGILNLSGNAWEWVADWYYGPQLIRAPIGLRLHQPRRPL